MKVYSGKKAASFHCDNAFSEADSNDDIYEFTIKPFFGQFTQAKPVKIFFLPKKKAQITIFTYGETGAGKSYTINGIRDRFIGDLFLNQKENTS